MAHVTLQVIEGFERGRVYANLPTPLTIGREEDNTIQLNDERISRFHVKIQEEGGRIILTDLESTNGTRVNGHPVQMRILQVGDQVCLGRSLLVFGSSEEIAHRAQQLQAQRGETATTDQTDSIPAVWNETSERVATGLGRETGEEAHSEMTANDLVTPLFPLGAPELPGELRPLQAAQLSDLLAYVHEQIAVILDAGLEDPHGDTREMRVDWATWQRLLKLEMDLAVYLRSISDPTR